MATCSYHSYGSQKISLNFSVIAYSSLSKLLYLPLEKLSDSRESLFFERDYFAYSLHTTLPAHVHVTRKEGTVERFVSAFHTGFLEYK